MSLIKQLDDGTPDNADTYADLSDAAAYFNMYGESTYWDNVDGTTQERALRKATRYLDLNFSWYSDRLTSTQALEFPRDPFVDSAGNYIEGIPQLLIDSVIQLADLYLQDVVDSTNNSSIKSESYGSTSVTYASSRKNQGSITLSKLLKHLGRYGVYTAHRVNIVRA